MDSGKIFRCANSNFPEGNLGWISLRKGIEKKKYTEHYTSTLQQAIDEFNLKCSAQTGGLEQSPSTNKQLSKIGQLRQLYVDNISKS